MLNREARSGDREFPVAAHYLQDLRGADNSGLVPDPNAGFACGSMVFVLSFSRTCGSLSHMFVKKHGSLPPCRRRHSLSVQWPHNSCYLQELCGGHANRAFHPIEAGFACGSMGLFFFFTPMFAHCANMGVKKDGFFHPAGGEAGVHLGKCPICVPTV